MGYKAEAVKKLYLLPSGEKSFGWNENTPLPRQEKSGRNEMEPGELNTYGSGELSIPLRSVRMTCRFINSCR